MAKKITTPPTGSSTPESRPTGSSTPESRPTGSSAIGEAPVTIESAGTEPSAGTASGTGTDPELTTAQPRTTSDTTTDAVPLDPEEERRRAEAARRAAVRDHATTPRPALARFLQVVLALFFPVIVVAAAVRAVATSSFLWLEYHRPGFPADSFGFSLEDRMTYGSYALDYVLNFAPPRYLGGIVTPGGEPLFLESEVGHMADVKGVLGVSFCVALVLFLLCIPACIYLARKYKGGIRRGLFAGSVLTLVGIVVLIVLAVLGWERFFTQVHALFFASGTWTFRVDDTLIRLFPEQFWTDAALTVAVLVLGATLLTLALTWPTRGRRERSERAQDDALIRAHEALRRS